MNVEQREQVQNTFIYKSIKSNDLIRFHPKKDLLILKKKTWTYNTQICHNRQKESVSSITFDSTHSLEGSLLPAR